MKTTDRTPFVITHNPGKPTTKTYMPVLHSSSRMRKAVPLLPIMGKWNCNNLRKMLLLTKPPTQKPHEPEQDKETEGCFKCMKKMHHLQRTSGANYHLEHCQNQKDILHQGSPELLFQQHYIPYWLWVCTVCGGHWKFPAEPILPPQIGHLNQ